VAGIITAPPSLRVWEKLHSALLAGLAAEPDPQRRQPVEATIEAGRQVVRCRQRGEEVPAALPATAERSAPAGQALLAFAGLDACRLAASGAAPLDPDVMEFFQALGLPMIEAWGMTELANAATLCPERYAGEIERLYDPAGPGVTDVEPTS